MPDNEQSRRSAAMTKINTKVTAEEIPPAFWLTVPVEGLEWVAEQSRESIMQFAGDWGATTSPPTPTSSPPPTTQPAPGAPPKVETWQDPTSGEWFYNSPNFDSYGNVVGYTWKPFSPEVPDAPYDEKANGGYEPGKVYRFETSDKKVYYAQYKGQGEWGTASWDEDTAMTPYQQQQGQQWQQQFDYQKEQDRIAAEQALAEQGRKTQADLDVLNNQRRANDIAARQAGVDQWLAGNETQAIPQRAYEAQMQAYRDLQPDKNAQNWINTWQWQNAPKPEKPAVFNAANNAWLGENGNNYGFATSAEDAARRGLSGWVPQDWQGNDPGAQWMDKSRQTIKSDPLYPQGRPETDQEYDYRVNQMRMEAARTVGAGGWNTGATGDPSVNQALSEWYKYNPDIGLEGYRGTTGMAGQNWLADLQRFIDDQMAEVQKSKQYGPRMPAWATQFGSPSITNGLGQVQLNVSKLRPATGGAGNWLAPVGAQTWNRMSTSEKSGLRGLVEASGRDWNDYIDESTRMMPRSTGPTARRKVTAF